MSDSEPAKTAPIADKSYKIHVVCGSDTSVLRVYGIGDDHHFYGRLPVPCDVKDKADTTPVDTVDIYPYKSSDGSKRLLTTHCFETWVNIEKNKKLLTHTAYYAINEVLPLYVEHNDKKVLERIDIVPILRSAEKNTKMAKGIIELGNGHVLIAYEDGEVCTIDLENPAKPKSSTHIDRKFTSWKLSPCKTRVAMVGPENTHVSVYDVESMKEIWKSKNVENDTLRQVVPIHDKDVVWLSSIPGQKTKKPKKSHVLAVCTAYGQIRIYDTHAQPRPIKAFSIGAEIASADGNGKHQQITNAMALNVSLNAIQNAQIEDHVYVSSNRCGVYLINLGNHIAPDKKTSRLEVTNGSISRRLKSISGSIRDIQLSQDQKTVAVVGLDRHVHLYSTKTYNLLQSVYTKLRLNAVAFFPEDWIPYIPPTKPNSANGEEDEESEVDSVSIDEQTEEMWNAMTPITNEPKKSKKRTSESAPSKPSKKVKLQ